MNGKILQQKQKPEKNAKNDFFLIMLYPFLFVQ